MYRLGLGALAVAAGLGLLCGCISLSDRGLFGRRSCPTSECCGDGGMMASEGPGLGGGCGAGMVGPPAPEMMGPMPLTPQMTTPQLAPPPRLVPQPQAQPAPFTP
jgi:hypothetical protein